ncbi:MAG: hypothetical protein AAF483_10790 [Planctomycetota bacterium]
MVQSLKIRKQAEGFTQSLAKLQDLPGWPEYCRGELNSAVEKISSALYSDEENGFGWELMGLIFRDLGKPKSAINAFERASLLVPMHPLASLCLAECYGAVGKTELARDLYLSYADCLDGQVEHLLLVAAGLEGIDEPHLAMEICRRASGIDPDCGQIAYDMCFYASRCGAQPALIESLAWRAVELEPDNVHFRVGLASLMIRLERLEKAFWVVGSLNSEQISSINCYCCIERLVALYDSYGDNERAELCRMRLRLLPPTSQDDWKHQE